jgi:hypothetical protein
MPSTLGWIDYDDSHQQSMKRVLAFFRERETRDELGLGAIRDSIADKLFPGTSTLQTRLRYMLFVPWIYQRLEAQRVAAAEVARKARRTELALIESLLATTPEGVIGRIARAELKTLPSSVYWAGLASWGILRFPGSQADYHRSFDRISTRRTNARRREDVDIADEALATWHGGLPSAPVDFPDAVSFALIREEAEYLRDRLREEHPDSLLACLAQESWPVPDEPYIWQHPRFASFRSEHKELVLHAHVFAETMHGAAVLYNLELARQREDKELIDQFHEQLAEWVAEMNTQQSMVRAFRLEHFWTLVRTDERSISSATRAFVAQWFDVALAHSADVADSDSSRRLVRERERNLKRAQSRFDNRVALSQWTGSSGLMMLNFRWRNAAILLRDLREGLADKEA